MSPRRLAMERVAATVLALALAAVLVTASAAVAFLADAPAASSVSTDDPVAAASPRQRAVFVCQEDGAPVFTDRPCGSGTGPRTLKVDGPATGAVPSTVPPRPRASTRPRPQPEGQDGTGRAGETRCAALQRQLDDVDDRMRAGYTSREAARLWNRWRELKGRLRAERC